jgi:hypothetical protein
LRNNDFSATLLPRGLVYPKNTGPHGDHVIGFDFLNLYALTIQKDSVGRFKVLYRQDRPVPHQQSMNPTDIRFGDMDLTARIPSEPISSLAIEREALPFSPAGEKLQDHSGF